MTSLKTAAKETTIIPEFTYFVKCRRTRPLGVEFLRTIFKFRKRPAVIFKFLLSFSSTTAKHFTLIKRSVATSSSLYSDRVKLNNHPLIGNWKS